MRRQLLQNRYYLSVLGNPIRSYTYISSQNRLVRLTNHDHLADTDWEQLCSELQNESEDYKGNAEALFQAELFLISPLTEPSRFLKKEYFLTAQQRDIERQILKKIRLASGNGKDSASLRYGHEAFRKTAGLSDPLWRGCGAVEGIA